MIALTKVRAGRLEGQQPGDGEAGSRLTEAGDYVDAETGLWILSFCPGFGLGLPDCWQLPLGWHDPAPDEFQPYASACGLGPALRGQAAINLHATLYHYDRPFEPVSTLLYVWRRGDPYQGGETVFPEYGVHLDMQDGDLAVFHSQRSMHGNLPRTGMGATSQRMSLMIHVPRLPSAAGTTVGS